jgi:septum site-determining protein MinD
VEDVLEILAVPLLGIIPESPAVLRASNVGTPIVLDEPSRAGTAYEEAVARLTGEQVDMRLDSNERVSFFQRLFKRSA